MSPTANPTPRGEDVETWLRSFTNCLNHKATELILLLVIFMILKRLLTQDSSQNHNHPDLTKFTCLLSDAFTAQLKLSDKHITHLQKELTCAQSRIDKLEAKGQDDFKRQTTEFLRELLHIQHCTDKLTEKTQDQLKVSDEMEHLTKRHVEQLQTALAVAERDQHELKSSQQNLIQRLQSAEQQVEEAKTSIQHKDAKIVALENQLSRYSSANDDLTKQLDDISDELYRFRELMHAYQQKPEPRWAEPSSASPPLSKADSLISINSGRSERLRIRPSPAFTTNLFPSHPSRKPLHTAVKPAQEATLKDLDKLAKRITQFNPNSTESKNIQAYLQDLDFYLEVRPHVTDRDRWYLLRSTSSPEVQSFLDRQRAHIKSNYQLLREALIEEFKSSESEHGVFTALETKQGRHETPQAFYHRFRQAYIAAHDDPDLEEDVNFKTLFLRNLHPGLSRHLGILACPRTMSIRQLRDLTHRAYLKQKSPKKDLKSSMASISQGPTRAQEDTLCDDDTTVYRAHRERDSYDNNSYYTDWLEKSRDQPRFTRHSRHPKLFPRGNRYNCTSTVC